MRKLYNDLLPALNYRISFLHNEGYECITTKDIFLYLEQYWNKHTNISDMVADIMNVSGYDISCALKNELYRRDLK